MAWPCPAQNPASTRALVPPMSLATPGRNTTMGERPARRRQASSVPSPRSSLPACCMATPLPSAGRDIGAAMPNAPVVLQVLPSLVTGGVERGTIEIAEGIAQAGGPARVASAGGRLVAAVERAGGRHITLPLHAKDPVTV